MAVVGALLEICIDDPAGLRAAVAGGADRIELCSALALGGLTPSPAMIAAAVQTGVPIHVMVRPRAGDFAYDDDEIALILDDIGRIRDLGVAGVVVGAASAAGDLDERALARFRDAAEGLAIVLHRAVDLTPDPVAAACAAAALGYDYVLTSGGALHAFDGRSTIQRMIAETPDTLTIIAGSGVTPEIASVLVRENGVTQIHASASAAHDWPDPRIAQYGFAGGARRVTGRARVQALRQAISGGER